MSKGIAWCGDIPDPRLRLYQSIQNKAAKYKSITVEKGLPFVVFVYPCFSAFVHPTEVKACLLAEDGLFRDYPTLGGVWHIDEGGNFLTDTSAGYRFKYHENPWATCLAPKLKDNALPYRIPPCDNSASSSG